MLTPTMAFQPETPGAIRGLADANVVPDGPQRGPRGNFKAGPGAGPGGDCSYFFNCGSPKAVMVHCHHPTNNSLVPRAS